MKLTLKVTRHTTDSELIHLGNFFTALGTNRGARVVATPTFSVPLDAAELDEPDFTLPAPSDVAEPTPAPAEVVAGTEPPKRRRRTKEEIAAATTSEVPQTQPEEVDAAIAAENSRVAAAEAEAQASNEAALAALGNADPAPTPDAQQPATPPSETASTTPASASPSEPAAPTGPITHADVQKVAIDMARRFGPEKVKGIISGYDGVGKIADLKDEDLLGFVAKLHALAA